MFEKRKIKKLKKKIKLNSDYYYKCGKMVMYEHFYCNDCKDIVPLNTQIKDITKEYILKKGKLLCEFDKYQLEVSVKKVLQQITYHVPRKKMFYKPLEIRSWVYKKIETGLARQNIVKLFQPISNI